MFGLGWGTVSRSPFLWICSLSTLSLKQAGTAPTVMIQHLRILLTTNAQSTRGIKENTDVVAPPFFFHQFGHHYKEQSVLNNNDHGFVVFTHHLLFCCVLSCLNPVRSGRVGSCLAKRTKRGNLSEYRCLIPVWGSQKGPIKVASRHSFVNKW